MKYFALLLCFVSLAARAAVSTAPGSGSAAVAANSIALVSQGASVVLSTGPAPNNAFYTAVSNAPYGSLLQFGPGSYLMTNWFFCPKGGGVVGAGRDVTVLVNQFTNVNPFPLVMLSDNCNLQHLTISNYYGDPSAGGIYSACFGTHYLASKNCYTNALIQDVKTWGGSDDFYNRHISNCFSLCINCEFHGLWDIVTSFGGTANLTNAMTFINCQFTNIATRTHGGIPSDVFVEAANAPTALTMIGCDLFSTGSTADRFIIAFQDGALVASSLYLHRCTLTGPTIVPGNLINFGSGDSMAALIQNTVIDPSRVGDTLDGAPGVNYGTNYVYALCFGGDAVNGLGPQIYSSGALDTLHVNNTLNVAGNISSAGSLTAKTSLVLTTNGAPPSVVATTGELVMSNYDLYLRTTKGTTLINALNH